MAAKKKTTKKRTTKKTKPTKNQAKARSKPRAPQSPEARLRRQLARAPLGTLVGVLAPRPVSGGRSQGERRPTMIMTLLAWQFDGGPVQRRELVVRKQVDESTLSKMMKRFDDYDVVRLRVRLAEENAFGSPQALLVRVLGKGRGGKEIDAAAAELKKPLTVEDERLGVLTYDRGVEWFEGEAPWEGGGRVAVYLVPESGTGADGIGPVLDLARRVWGEGEEWERRAKDKAVDRLLDLKNESWLDEDEGEEPLSEEEFRANMRLTAVQIAADGSIEFTFADGDMFFGHDIVVKGTVEEGWRSANIEG